MEKKTTLREMVGFTANRGIDKYAEAFGMDRREFLAWLSTKERVLDISSGGGLLSKEIDILKQRGELKSDVEVVSLDLAYATSEGLSHAKYVTHLAFHNQKETPTRKRISETDQNFKKTAVAGSFTSLPFASKTFDGILGSFTFGVHANNKGQLISAYKEVQRVLKDNGSGFISVVPGRFTEELRTIDKENPVFYETEDISFLNPKLERYSIIDEVDGNIVDYYYLAVDTKKVA